MQTLNKPCNVKQEHETDTQEGRATDKKGEVTHLVGSHTLPAGAAKMLTALRCRVSLSVWRFVPKLPSLQQIPDCQAPSPQTKPKTRQRPAEHAYHTSRLSSDT